MSGQNKRLKGKKTTSLINPFKPLLMGSLVCSGAVVLVIGVFFGSLYGVRSLVSTKEGEIAFKSNPWGALVAGTSSALLWNNVDEVTPCRSLKTEVSQLRVREKASLDSESRIVPEGTILEAIVPLQEKEVGEVTFIRLVTGEYVAKQSRSTTYVTVDDKEQQCLYRKANFR